MWGPWICCLARSGWMLEDRTLAECGGGEGVWWSVTDLATRYPVLCVSRNVSFGFCVGWWNIAIHHELCSKPGHDWKTYICLIVYPQTPHNDFNIYRFAGGKEGFRGSERWRLQQDNLYTWTSWIKMKQLHVDSEISWELSFLSYAAAW